MRRILPLLYFCSLFIAPAKAQLYIKNDAPYTIWVAIGYYVPSSKAWYSKGWFKLDDDAATNVFDYDLSYNSYYYYYAFDKDGNYWSGGSNCTTCSNFLIDPDNKFNLNSSITNTNDDYVWKKFKRINADGVSSFTLRLTAEDWCDGDCENGYGIFKWIEGSKKYSGNWRNGKREGSGTCEYGKYHTTYAGCKFEGEWRNNTWYSGTFTWPDGATFTGKWIDEKKSGNGVMQWADGSKYEGNWRDDERNGYGKMYHKEKDKTYTGQWSGDKRNGEGVCIYGSNNKSYPNCRFEGIWKADEWASGTFYYADGSKYVGQFSNFKKNGKGILYSQSGTILKSGEWVNDVLITPDSSSPVITWDAPINKRSRSNNSNFHIEACIQSTSPLTAVKVYLNGQVYKDRGFSVETNCAQNIDIQLPLRTGENTVYVTATNSSGTTQSETRIIDYSASPVLGAGQYYGLFIGIEAYQELALQNLQHPIKDASQLMNVLTRSYNFKSSNCSMLSNPNKKAIVDEIQRLQGQLTESDYLLIFFAGHGKIQGTEGYWLAADAKTNSAYNWISSSELNGYLRGFRSKHVLLISDACYSGAFVMRDMDDLASPQDQKACEILEQQKSRCAMTSGAKTSVPDKSVFMEYLMRKLESTEESCFSAEQLYLSFKTAVISNSPNNQIPQYGQIPQTGHEGGGFIFYKK